MQQHLHLNVLLNLIKLTKKTGREKQHKLPHSLVSSYSLQVLHRRNEARALVLANCGSASALLDTEELHWTAAPLCWISAPVFHLTCSIRKKCILVINSLRFDGHFPGEPGLAGVYWSKGWWRWWWQLDYWSYKSCKAPVKSSPPTNQHYKHFLELIVCWNDWPNVFYVLCGYFQFVSSFYVDTIIQ